MTTIRDTVTTRNDQSQLFEYGNPFFECFSTNVYFPPHMPTRATEHWHEDIEYLYVVEGELDFNVNGTTIHLNAGEGICVNSRRIHSNNSVPGKTCAFYCAICHPNLITSNRCIEQSYIRPLISANSFDYIKLTADNWTSEIIDIIINLYENVPQQGIEIAIMAALYEIWYKIYMNIGTPPVISNSQHDDQELFRNMISYIQRNYRERISLSDIASSSNIGKTFCATLFKRYASRTPGEYLIYYRIQKATELLRNTDMTTTEIAYNTGFSSPSHFAKTFKQLNGTTPQRYRHDAQTLSSY